MYQLLIVDDEVLAAHGIEKGVDWDKLGFSTVHIAYNIRQAMAIIENGMIDVMICDIEMPQGSGLDLLRWVKDHDCRMETLLLTCHADFEYAKQAMQLGSLEYLLKPVKYEELRTAVEKAIQKLERERRIVIQKLWLELFNQTGPMEPEQVLDVLKRYGVLSMEQASYVPVLVSLRGMRYSLTAREEEMLSYSLRSTAEIMFDLPRGQGDALALASGTIVVIVRLSQRDLVADCSAYIAACKEQFECELSCYMGQPVKIGGLRGMVDQLLHDASLSVSSINEVYHFDAAVSRREAVIRLPESDRWLELLQLGAKMELLSELAAYYDSMKQEPVSVALLNELYQNYLQAVLHVLHINGLQAHRICSGSLSTERAVHAIRSVANLKDWALRLTETALDFIASVKESHTVVERAKLYISENIQKDLLREDIASFVYLNPDYLSRLFKKETGLTLSEYLLSVRLKEAKQLLIRTNMSVSEIASSLGYSNFSHFSKMFRRMSRMNPLEYRKLNK